MGAPCCEKSFEKTRRPCPRCSRPICHHCGVIAGGALVCGDCAVRPPASADPESEGGTRETARLLAAAVAGLGFGLVGAALWSIAGGFSGYLVSWGAAFPALGSRLGVRIALREREPDFRVLTVAVALASLLAGLWFSAFRDVAALYAPGSPGLPEHVRQVFGDSPPASLFDIRVPLVLAGYLFAGPGPILLAVVLTLAAAVIVPRRR